MKYYHKILHGIRSSKVPEKDVELFKRSYSQCGEDLLVDYIFKLRGISHPSYIDIGANHPLILSNTAVFYERGCRGINIEANPFLMDNFILHRPEDININIGVGSKDDVLEFYIMNDSTLSSFSRDEVDKYIETGKYYIQSTREIKIVALNQIINDYCNGVFPDFLSIDTEGMDYEILSLIDYRLNSPKVICVEAAEYSPIGAGERRTELVDFLSLNGYYEYANTNLNAIMVRRDFWFI